MFFSNFQEREKNQVELEDVILEEFSELLHVIYPCHKPVTADNVEYLLELGDKYEIQYVMDECERFLIGTDEVLPITKLTWADQYLLAKLQVCWEEEGKVSSDNCSRTAVCETSRVLRRSKQSGRWKSSRTWAMRRKQRFWRRSWRSFSEYHFACASAFKIRRKT